MMRTSIECSCITANGVVLLSSRKMAIAALLLLNLVLVFEKATAVPDYKKLHENLSLREDSEKAKSKVLRHQDGTLLTAEVGKVFKYSLQDVLLKEGKDHVAVHIFEHGKTGLPLWLSYNEKKQKLVGVPMHSDVGKFKIILKIGTKSHKKKFKFEVNVKDGRDTFACHRGSPVFIAAALLSADFQSFNGLTRMKLLRKFADYVDIGLHELIVAEKKPGNVLDMAMETAGPGDGIVTKAPGVIVKWKVNCKLGVAGDRSVNLLKASSGNKLIFKSIGVPFLGWYVYRHQTRHRRQAAPTGGATPAATPSATPAATKLVPVVTSTISGTPMITATPTLVIKSTSTIAVAATSTSAVPIKPTPVVTSKPTTKPPTTTEKATTEKIVVTTKEKTTTMKPETTTMKPETTTMKPETTTMKPETTTMKPETTTMKPETTTMKPEKTTMKMDTTEAPETTDMIPKTTSFVKPTMKNLAPVLKNSIDLIQVNAGQAFKVKIENDVFEDDNDGNTYNLLLALKKNVVQKLKDVDEAQIYLDTKNYYLYGLPTLANVGDNSYALQATDSSGKQTNAVFTVRVLDENTVYNDVFNVSVDLNYEEFVKNAKNKVKLVEKIAETTGVAFKSMRLHKFYRGSVVMSYSSSELQTADCNSVKAHAYKAKLEGSGFKDAMAPDYIVLSATAKKEGTNCGGNANRRKSPTKSGDGSYKWWEVVLIPVIVIAVLLLVIGLIFFFLYRRKRRYEPQKEDKNTFLYQKKPIIFQEEYGEKPDLVSLEPLFLPNEKAPLTNAAYQPRTSTPDENGSTPVTTEDEEEALVDKKKNQTPPPQTPPPRSPPYGRSPPPYTEP